MNTIDINISFNINNPDTNENESTNINFHTSDSNLDVSEYVSFMKRAALAYGFSESDMARITVTE